MFNEIFIVMSKEIVFWLFWTLRFCRGICIHMLAWSKVLRKSRKLSTKDISPLFEIFTSSWRNLTLPCRKIAKLEQLDCKRFCAGASVNSQYWMLGLTNVKNVVVKITIYVSFVQKLLWYSFVRWKRSAKIGNSLLDRHQLPLVSKFCKSNLSVV